MQGDIMELVPFNAAWADSGNKFDLKAIYKGKDGDDRLVALPVRRHNDWSRKGLTYVTLATAEDVVQVKDWLRSQQVDLNALQQSYEGHGSGPFKMAAYIAEGPKRDADEKAALQARLSHLEGKGKKGAA
jgi:hypothetical protein